VKQGCAQFSFNVFSTGGVMPSGGFFAHASLPTMFNGRAGHAKMLAHAAKRRLAAQGPSQDRAYWKAGAPVALNRAIAIRRDAGLAKLP
jgi:hypothetical protein